MAAIGQATKRGVLVKTGEALEVGKAGEGVPLVQLFGYDPCEVLNRKLGWSGSAIR